MRAARPSGPRDPFDQEELAVLAAASFLIAVVWLLVKLAWNVWTTGGAR